MAYEKTDPKKKQADRVAQHIYLTALQALNKMEFIDQADDWKVANDQDEAFSAHALAIKNLIPKNAKETSAAPSWRAILIRQMAVLHAEGHTAAAQRIMTREVEERRRKEIQAEHAHIEAVERERMQKIQEEEAYALEAQAMQQVPNYGRF